MPNLDAQIAHQNREPGQKKPKGPKIKKFQDLEIFKRDWKFQASHPPNPIFLVGNSEGRDWNVQSRFRNFQARLKISSEIDFFQSLGP